MACRLRPIGQSTQPLQTIRTLRLARSKPIKAKLEFNPFSSKPYINPFPEATSYVSHLKAKNRLKRRREKKEGVSAICNEINAADKGKQVFPASSHKDTEHK